MINFKLDNKGPISRAFVNLHILDFNSSCAFVADVPYARNTDTSDELIVLKETRGTCSTKHALLKRLLEENGIKDVKLMIGIFLINEENTPRASEFLRRNQIVALPEAHCYLRLQDEIMDFTFPDNQKLNFEATLIKEISITPSQIVSFKAQLHFDFIKDWLPTQAQIKKTPKEIWRIREDLIQTLSNHL